MSKIGIGLVLGVILVALAMAVYANSQMAQAVAAGVGPCPPVCDAATPISVAQAEEYSSAYVEQNAPNIAPSNKIKAFMVNNEQLSAMNQLAAANPDLAGFRVYLGSSAEADEVATVVGVDSSGHDVLTGTVFLTDKAGSGPCPDVCDAESPLNAN
ncbi:MAG: hypothetical protein WC861_01200 [Candidatus Micrarchaeia archaeon]|jgi:hypothetical protein